MISPPCADSASPSTPTSARTRTRSFRRREGAWKSRRRGWGPGAGGRCRRERRGERLPCSRNVVGAEEGEHLVFGGDPALQRTRVADPVVRHAVGIARIVALVVVGPGAFGAHASLGAGRSLVARSTEETADSA